MIDEKAAAVFAGLRGVSETFKHDLDILAEIRKEHDNNIEKLRDSLEEMEFSLKERGIEIDISHLAIFANYLDDNKMKMYRKRILDRANALMREIEFYRE